MKPDYKNWVPKGMMLIMLIISAVLLTCFLLFGVCGIGVQGVFRLMLGVLLGIAFLICGGCAAWCVCAYRSFSYSGKRRLSKQIVEGTAKYIRLPDQRKRAGRWLRQRRFDHRMCERQPAGGNGRDRPLGKGIRFLQQKSV